MHNAEGATSDDISSSPARIADSAVHPTLSDPARPGVFAPPLTSTIAFPRRIRDAKQIEAYVVWLCELIEMEIWRAGSNQFR